MGKINLTKIFLVFFICCFDSICLSQNIDEYSYKLCEENQGKATFDLYDVGVTILNENNFFGVESTIIIGTISGKIIQYSQLQSNNIQELILCTNSQDSPWILDIAVDSNKNVFIADWDGISIVDFDNVCSFDLVYEGQFRGLSFDKLGYLYFGGENIIYRTRNGRFDNIEIWHDFEEGVPSGDFVDAYGKMYVAWNINDVDYLYEVTVDNGYNYVSHVNLGILPEDTFGLASELGILYGISVRKIFEINVRDFSFRDIFINDSFNSGVIWYGGAGLHEAIDIKFTFHETILDVENNIEITEDFLFTEPKIIYIKYTNIKNGQSITVAASLEVINKLIQIDDIQSCENYELPPIENASYYIEVRGERVKIPSGAVIKRHTELFIVGDLCGDEISFNIDIVATPKFFTPNDDGINDEWKLNCDDFIDEKITIRIFDRFGKALFQTSNQEQGWDGTHNNRKLPSGNYWFSLIGENGRSSSGHFALKR